MPFSKQNHIQHEICMFVSTGRVGSCTRILSNDLTGVTSPVVIIVSLKWSNLTDLQIDLQL